MATYEWARVNGVIIDLFRREFTPGSLEIVAFCDPESTPDSVTTINNQKEHIPAGFAPDSNRSAAGVPTP
jgi:hypothetical protein